MTDINQKPPDSKTPAQETADGRYVCKRCFATVYKREGSEANLLRGDVCLPDMKAAVVKVGLLVDVTAPCMLKALRAKP